MESIAYYKNILLQKHSAKLSEDEQKEAIASCVKLFDELQLVDPERKQRYVELCKNPPTL